MKKIFKSINIRPKKKYTSTVFAVFFSMFFGFFVTDATLMQPKIKGVHTPKKSDVKKVHILTTPNDSRYSSQWSLPKTRAPEGWDTSTGSDTVVVAVIDTGVLSAHEDLSGNMWTNTGEMAGNGIDDDGNGKIDDINGWDFVGDDNNANPNPGGGDAFYHGTIVSSVIAASTNNSKGIAGECWNCKIMPVRALDNNGIGSSDNVAQGIRYAADSGADVINMSLGSTYADGSDPDLESAVQHAYDMGVVIVAASGNDGQGVNYPAAYPEVIAVGATDSSDVKASWSSYGSALDVMAPGVNIPSACTLWTGFAYTTNTYCTASGTSLSSPHVAGLVGLVLSAQPEYFTNLMASDPTLVSDNMLSRMITQAYKVSEMGSSNFTPYYGYGRVNNYYSLIRWLSLSNPKSGSNTTKSEFEITGAARSSTEVDISLDGGDPMTTTSTPAGTWAYVLSGLAYGIHTLEITSLDMAGGPQTIIGSYNRKASVPVYRFWSSTKKDHYYTTSKSQRDSLIADYPNTVWKYQGVAFRAYSEAIDLNPVYSFWSSKYTDHYYTKSRTKALQLIRNYPNTVWKYQGVSFYAHSSQVAGSTPVYSFWSSTKTDHYYTASKSQRDSLIADYPNTVWKYQGVAFYAL